MDFTPLFLSLRAAGIATILVIIIGIPVSYRVAYMKRGRGIVDSVCTLPMVLPPTVVGFFLLLFFGKNSMVGAWLMGTGNSRCVFSQTGMVIASAVSLSLFCTGQQGEPLSRWMRHWCRRHRHLELGREEFSSGLCVQTVCRGFWLG